MTTTACIHHAREGGGVRHRATAVLLFAVALLTSLGWTQESWGQAKLPRVGILTYGGTTDESVKQWLDPFRRKLADKGWIEGQQVAFEYRRAVGDPSQLAEAAADLTRLKVDVIFADSAPSLRAAHAATSTIPIVATDFTNDPIAAGYVESYGRPGRNITGVFLDAPGFSGEVDRVAEGHRSRSVTRRCLVGSECNVLFPQEHGLNTSILPDQQRMVKKESRYELGYDLHNSQIPATPSQ